MKQSPLNPPPGLSLLVACCLIALCILALSRVSLLHRGAPTIRETIPAAPIPADSTPADLIVERSPAFPEDASPEPNVLRPEAALLQGLPEVRTTRATDSPLNDLRVSFKLEPRLTRSLYMGDRWTSSPSYLQVGAGASCTVEAGIRGLNAQGKAVTTPATWRCADPSMVQISESGPGNTVKLTVLRPGQTTIEIASQGIVKELPLHAVSYGGTLLVAMLQ